MTTISISLPESLTALVQERAAEEGYDSISDYVAAALQEVEKRRADEVVEELLLEGWNDQQELKMTGAEWEELKRRHRERRLEELRADIQKGLDALDRGEAFSGAEVFHMLRERNRKAQEAFEARRQLDQRAGA